MRFFIRGDRPFVENEFTRVDYSSSLLRTASKFLNDIGEKEFKNNPHHFFLMSTQLRTTLAILERLKIRDLGKITFLDLGCGSDPPIDHPDNSPSNYPHKPYLARTLTHLGVRVIGIDRGPLDKETFEHHSLDLMCPDSLSFIPSRSIDVVHSYLLECSPSLHREYQEIKKDLPQILFPQILRVLREGGYCISDFKFEELEKIPEFRTKVY